MANETPSWRNWQTRTFQGRVDVSPSGFKSLARHQRIVNSQQ